MKNMNSLIIVVVIAPYNPKFFIKYRLASILNNAIPIVKTVTTFCLFTELSTITRYVLGIMNKTANKSNWYGKTAVKYFES